MKSIKLRSSLTGNCNCENEYLLTVRCMLSEVYKKFFQNLTCKGQIISSSEGFMKGYLSTYDVQCAMIRPEIKESEE